MNTYLVIKDERVINTVIWDGVSEWTPPDGTTVELAPDSVGVGWIRINGAWIQPSPAASSQEEQNRISARTKLLALGLSEEEVEALIK